MFRDVEEILERQSGVISRRQALSTGMQQHDIRRLLRRNEWARVHHGVYVDYTGPLTWPQEAWAAVLYAAPAALCLGSALRAADGPGRSMRDEAVPIHVAIARQRAMLTEPEGVRIHHVAQFDERVLWNVGPPRLRYEDAALDVACAATSEPDAIAVLADCCQSRRTTARRLLHTLNSRLRVRRRRWLQDVLADIADGTCSVPSTDISIAWSDPTACPGPCARNGMPRQLASITATRSTADDSLSSSTAACSMTPQLDGTQTSSVISTLRPSADRPSGFPTARSSADRAEQRRKSPKYCAYTESTCTPIPVGGRDANSPDVAAQPSSNRRGSQPVRDRDPRQSHSPSSKRPRAGRRRRRPARASPRSRDRGVASVPRRC